MMLLITSEADLNKLKRHMQFFRHGGQFHDGKHLYFEIDINKSKQPRQIKSGYDPEVFPLYKYRRKKIGEGSFAHQVQSAIILSDEEKIIEVAVKNIEVKDNKVLEFGDEARLPNVDGAANTERALIKESKKYGQKGLILIERGNQYLDRWRREGLNSNELKVFLMPWLYTMKLAKLIETLNPPI